MDATNKSVPIHLSRVVADVQPYDDVRRTKLHIRLATDRK